jgi:uncharacterized protein with von Willebrand factor type A (vWA) domain
VLFDEQAWKQIRLEAQKIAGEVADEALTELDRDWKQHARSWAQLRRMFEELADTSGVPRERVRGLLSAIDWRRAVELRKIFASLPPMRSLVTQLGRQRAPRNPDADRALETLGGEILREHVIETTVRELGVVEICGVERSDEISRMLASELALRAHSATRLLWHARRAERALLTYHADSVYTNRIIAQQGFRSGSDIAQPRPERGPIIVLLDTSGSMSGRKEMVAKALVLQALAVAQLEDRAVYVYNFSADGELAEHQLSLAHDALAHAIAFLAISFGGTTQIDEALRRAAQRAQTEAWAAADLLIVTDGFLDDPLRKFDRATIHTVNTARRRQQFRVHVALVVELLHNGTHTWTWEDGSSAPNYHGDPHWVIKEIADHIHDVASWLDKLAPTT